MDVSQLLLAFEGLQDVFNITSINQKMAELTGQLLPESGSPGYIFAIIGVVYVGKVTLFTLWDILGGLKALYWSRLWDKQLVKTYGEWAVVTGCTDGIGKEYAKHLAKGGMKIVLISRSLEKLKNTDQEIREANNVETKIVQADFAEGRPIYKGIAKHLQEKDIGVLVNNVGIANTPYKAVDETTEDEDWEVITVNISSAPAMTKLVLPGMKARGRGAIVNLSSIVAIHPNPNAGLYAATKVFMEFFSVLLEYECHKYGITVQTLAPGFTSTNLLGFSSYFQLKNPFLPSAATFTSSAFCTLGYARRTSGYWFHGILSFLMENVLSRRMGLYTYDAIINFSKRGATHVGKNR